MHTLRELNLLPVWVNPSHMVETAIHVMRGHDLPAIGVVEGGDLIGWLSLDRAILLAPLVTVEEAMEPVKLTLEESMGMRQAAKEFVRAGLSYLPVCRDDEFVGMLSATMLLGQVDSGYDPLTDLPWSDRLREWGRAELTAGGEITLLFFDLDDFGSYNKRHGHIVGDRVLKGFASTLHEAIEPGRDVVVRYGGDEFVIGTTLMKDAALMEFASLLGESVRIREVEEPLRYSVGISGGKRLQERSDAHIAAMLEDLINLASMDCMQRKQERLRVKTEVSAPVVMEVDSAGEIEKGFVTVKCRVDDEEVVGTSPKTESPLLDVARASVNAVHVLDPGPGYQVRSARIIDQEGLLVVIAVIAYRTNGVERTHVVSAPVIEDQFNELANAIFVPLATKSQAGG